MRLFVMTAVFAMTQPSEIASSFATLPRNDEFLDEIASVALLPRNDGDFGTKQRLMPHAA